MTAQSPTETPVVEEWPPADPGVRERLRELPPSAKLIAWVLAADGPLTKDAIATTSLLPTGTVVCGLDRLEEIDLIVVRPSLHDARKQVYDLQP